MAISLSKGQRLSLEKETGRTLDRVVMGLGWDTHKRKGLFGFLGGGDVDLDASAGLFDAQGNLLDQVWFQQLQSKDGSVRHSGDNVTGAGEGDDEQIQVQLSKVPAQVQTMVFVVTSYSGDSFDKVENAFCRLVDSATNQEVARFTLSGKGSHTALIMVSVYRKDGGWSIRAVGEPAMGRSIRDILPQMRQAL
jgi:tellurium resistance protein TerZ